MKSPGALVAAVVAAIFAALIGYFVGAAVDSPGESTAPPAGVEPTPVDQKTVVDRPRAQPVPAVETPFAPPAKSPLEAYLTSLAEEVPKPGNGRIYGKVATQSGTPVPGIRVIAWAKYPGEAPVPGDEPALPELVDRYARRNHFLKRGEYTALTNAEGWYEITGLGEYLFSAQARGKGYSCKPVGRTQGAWDIKPDAEVDFVAEARCELQIEVRLPDSSQPARADMTLRYKPRPGQGSSGSHVRGWTPRNDTWIVEPGEATLEVTAGEHKQYFCDPIEVDIQPNPEGMAVKVQLRSEPGILCHITAPPNLQGGTDLRVDVEADPPADPPESGTGQGRTIRSGDRRDPFEGRVRNGAATFLRMKPGRYRLILRHNNIVMAWKDVILGEQFLEVTLAAPEPDKSGYIVARVYSPEGELLRDVNLRLAMRGDGSYSGAGTPVLKQPDGSFWLGRTAPKPSPNPNVKPWDWFYEVAVTTTKWGEYKASYPRDATHELEIRIERPAMLTVQIPNAGDHPAKDRARGELYEGVDTSWIMSPVARVNQPSRADGKIGAGEAKYGPMQPGTYTFQIKLGEDDFYSPRRGAEIAHWTFEVTSGDNTQICPIPPLHRLTLTVENVGHRAGLRMQSADKRIFRQLGPGDSKGQFVVEDLTPGEWRVFSDEGEMMLRIGGDMVAAFNIKPFDCVLLSMTRRDGPIEALGLRTGDKLIAVDGQAFDSIRTLRLQMLGSEAKDSTTWTVLRGGQSVDIAFNGKRLAEIRADRSVGGDNYGATPAYRQ